MNNHKYKKEKTLAIDELKESQIWDDDKMNQISQYILSESKKQSKERKLINELLSIKYQIQDYIENENIEKEMRILDFVKLYLRLLNITQRELATLFKMKDTNLYKYLIGERKLNLDLVFKLSSFSNTPPELWYYIQTKNELNELRKEKEKLKEYEKYDYKNIVSLR